jgi:3-oxoadipate enol-lactonase
MQAMPPVSGERLKVNGTELFVRIDGSPGAPWVVLLNSLAADTRMWAGQVQALGGHYRILRMDWRGHGGSRNEPAPYSLALLSSDVVAAMASLGVERPHLAGSSLGGMVAMTIAIERRAAIASLTVCSALSRMRPEMARWWAGVAADVRARGLEQAVLSDTIGRWFTPEFANSHPEVVATTRQMIMATTIDAYAGCIDAFRNIDLSAQMPTITEPTLFLVGESDPASTPEIMAAMQAQVPGSHLRVIPGCAHLPSLERPVEVATALLSFFDGVPCDSAA